ncbi:Imm51 family immunity protein [Hymenobacter sp. YC55]|uniref:Imm51 family immunity protein n=1 Tax=Hymenobacter sp. YC55 TaxID=3034019 RepID=UPI0023F943F7|nr:Imm51 family immunity protein [Hymenobacter sp. YC55]MDF7811729.1 Imm51 family immunity protein [Hymenobacter sp. YC55]
MLQKLIYLPFVLLLLYCNHNQRSNLTHKEPLKPAASSHYTLKKLFPFQVTPTLSSHLANPNRRFSIQVPVGEVEGYYNLFAKHGYGGNGPSWVEHIHFILEEKDAALLDHLEFDEEADTFLVYADSEETVSRFMTSVLPIFGSLKSLEHYFEHVDSDKFTE